MAEFREPTTRLPLRWGFYRTRYLGGLVLIVAGAVGLQGANPHILYLLLLGTAAHAVGWSILPAAGWRRLTVAAPGVGAIWALLTGPQSVWVLTLSLACWLLVRHRPARSYLALLLPLVVGILIPPLLREYTAMPVALAVMAVAIVGGAWIARLIAQGAVAPGKLSASIR